MKIRGLITVRDLLTGQCTLKQLFYQIQMRYSNTQAHLNDDFDWTKYHNHYLQELRVMEKCFTLLPQPGNFSREGTRVSLQAGEKPFHPNHHLLYETILALKPSSVLEVGCGGGDHLRNLKLFIPELNLYGIDRSESQLRTLRFRHPNIQANLNVLDVTSKTTQTTPVDLVYSQAVLMHISEANGRYLNALSNMFRSAKSYVVLVENWTRHNFLNDVRSIVQDRDLDWQNAYYYFNFREAEPNVRAMIIAKTPLNYAPLGDYEDLLQSKPMELNNSSA
jgi:ubiquinone/menaquinone biosynthesis C-methylase UbiE